MIRQSTEGEEVKNRRKKVAERRVMSCERKGQATDTGFEEIDPAEFFDPEEFGVGRRDTQKP
jgi:hypothetical protein